MSSWLKMVVSGAVVFSICGYVACKVVDKGDAGRDVTVLKVENNDVSGWTEDADGFKRFATQEQVFDAINGEQIKYARYLQDGFKQDLSKGGTDRTCRYVVMDCGTAEDATALFNDMTINIGTKTPVGSYALTIAVIDPLPMYGCDTYAHFGKYYVEIKPVGFSPKADANSTALSFLQQLEDKISKM